MSVTALTQTTRTAATLFKTGIQNYKTVSEFISIPLVVGFSAFGAASGYEHARKKGHGVMRSGACAVAHIPFYAFLGYGLGPVVIPTVTALSVGYMTGLTTFEYSAYNENDKKAHLKASETNFKYTKTKLPSKENKVDE
jgi:hypothetical protein